MRGLPLAKATSNPVDYRGIWLAPTFENKKLLGSRHVAFRKLVTLGNDAITAAATLLKEHPVLNAYDKLGSVEYYVNTALFDEKDGPDMHFPDVSKYWPS